MAKFIKNTISSIARFIKYTFSSVEVDTNTVAPMAKFIKYTFSNVEVYKIASSLATFIQFRFSNDGFDQNFSNTKYIKYRFSSGRVDA